MERPSSSGGTTSRARYDAGMRRRRGEGSIVQRPDGRHEARVVVAGRRAARLCGHVHAPGTPECADARRALRDLRRQRDEGALPVATMTLGAYLRRWLESVDGTVAPATYAKYEQHVRLHLAPRLGGIRMEALTERDVEAYLRRADLSPLTLSHHRNTLRIALRGAERQLRHNAARLSRPVDVPDSERPVLDADQARALIAGTAADHAGECELRDGACRLPHFDRLHALWVLLVATGLREAEALGLTWPDVDLAEGRVEVRRTLHRIGGAWAMRPPKTDRSERAVHLPAVALEALADHRRRMLEAWIEAGRPGEPSTSADGQPCPAGMVFTAPASHRYPKGGRPVHPTHLSKMLRAHTARLGLPDVRVHDLRHSAATILYAEGVDMPTIADLLGHSTPRITESLYRHRVEPRQRHAADAMGRALG